MSVTQKIANRMAELEPSYSVAQKISLPIYSFDLNDRIDADQIKDKCLALKTIQNNKPDLVRFGWQSPYYVKNLNPESIEQFDNFSDLITAIEQQISRIVSYCSYEIREFWVVIYDKGSSQEFHKHIIDAPSLKNTHKFSATYYPAASKNSSPIIFKNEDKENLAINVSKGKLILFPSSLEHGVPESTEDETRIVISFNLNIKS